MEGFFILFAISLLGLGFLFFNTLFSFYYIKKIKNPIYTFFSFYLAFILIIETFCHIIGFLNPGSNYFISHLYFNGQFILISTFLVLLMSKDKKAKFVISITSLVVLIIIALTYKFDYFSFWEFNLVEICLTSLVIFAYILYYFKSTISNENVDFVYFFSGLSIYLLSSVLIFITGNVELVLIDKPFIDIWVLNSAVYLLYQYFVIKEIFYFKNKTT